MSTTPSPRSLRSVRRSIVTGAAVASVLGLSACGASLDAQTYQERNNAETTDTAVGSLALRDLGVDAPRGEAYDVGDDAEMTITVTSVAPEDDRLVEASSPDAEEVAVVDEDGQEAELEVPALGSTQGTPTLELRGLTRELRSGEFITLRLRFAENGSTEMLVPVRLTGESDREVYTGERETGGEEPALQAPAGGKEHSDGGGDEVTEDTTQSDATEEDAPEDVTTGN